LADNLAVELRAKLDLPRPSIEPPGLDQYLLPKLHSAQSRVEYFGKRSKRSGGGDRDLAQALIVACTSWYFCTMEAQMTHMMRACSALIAVALGLVVAAAPATAQNAPQCVVSGVPSGWGVNSTGYIQIDSGGSCMFSVNIAGQILSSSVSQNPAHGTLQQLNVSSFLYTSQAGYRGGDAFSVQATGKSQTSSGASIITINATLQ